jgi:hypothetical protein
MLFENIFNLVLVEVCVYFISLADIDDFLTFFFDFIYLLRVKHI